MKLAKMNLAIHGLPGDIKEGNAYYQDVHESVDKFDYVMANPPFNTDNQDPGRIYNMERFPFGLPTTANGSGITQNGGNFLWAQIFYSALNKKGRAGFVMANGASTASGSQGEIRKKLIETGHVDVIIACPNHLFYNVGVPCTLWFFDKGKPENRKDTVLFIDARNIFEQIDAAHTKFSNQQIEFLSNIVRLYRGEKIEKNHDSKKLMNESFPGGKYVDVAGLCKFATRAEIEEKGWVLSPGRYIDIVNDEISDEDFEEKMGGLAKKLQRMFKESEELEKKVKDNLGKIGF
jgi:type I restriction enzyme M protein